VKKSLLLASLLLLPALAFASTSDYSPTDIAYLDNIYAFAHGAWGTGIAVAMMLLGGFLGVAHCGPGVTLAGVAGAAVINWGPTIVMHILGVPVPADPAVDKPPVAAHVATASAATTPTSNALTK
jgi:conjugal transfer pilus assembly protein TraA